MWFTYEQVPLPTLSAVVSDGGGGTEEVDWAASRERTRLQKGRSQVKLLLHLWVQTLPCRHHAGLLPPRLGCVVLCQHMPRCISTDASAPAATARPLSSRNTHCGLWDRNLCQCHAGCVSQQPRMEWAKQTQPWSIPLVFPLYFQDTASEALIQRRRLNITRLEMNRRPVQRATCPQGTVCRGKPGQRSSEKSEKEKGREKNNT